MDVQGSTEQQIRQLLTGQGLGVVSTTGKLGPHASLVAIAGSDDLRHVFFATPTATRKYANLRSDDQVAVLIDNRGNTADDFHQAAAITVNGRASECDKQDKRQWVELLVSRHPYLKSFVHSPSCAFFAVHIENCRLVTRFQQVVEYRPR